MISSSTYTLTHDLHLSPQTPLVVTKSCVIHANNHTISCYNGAPGCIRLAPGVRVVLQQAQVVEVSPETCERHARSELVWGDGSIVLFARGGQLQQQWHVRGAVTFFGNAATLSFGEAGGIVLEPDTRLVLNTCVLRGVNAQTISCLGMNTTLALAHSALQLHGDWLMSAGAFEVLYDSAIVGPYTLRYRTNEQSRIAPHAALRFADGLYFSYEPAGERIDGLVAEDMTSSLFVDSATIGTSTVAWHYRQGRLLLNGSLEGFGGGIVLTGTNFVPRSARVYWAGSVVV